MAEATKDAEESTAHMTWTDRKTLEPASFAACCLILTSILAYAARPAFGYVISVLVFTAYGFLGFSWPFLLLGLIIAAAYAGAAYICEKRVGLGDWFPQIVTVLALSIATTCAVLLQLVWPFIVSAYDWDPDTDAMATSASSMFNEILISITVAFTSITLAGWLVHLSQHRGVTNIPSDEPVELSHV